MSKKSEKQKQSEYPSAVAENEKRTTENEHRINNIKRYHMQTQDTQKDQSKRSKRSVYQAPNVEKIQIDTEFTYFSTSQDPVPANPTGNSLTFNPLKFLK